MISYRHLCTSVGENCIKRRFITCTHEVRLDHIKRMRWEEHLARSENVRYAYKRLIGESEKKNSWKTDVDGEK